MKYVEQDGNFFKEVSKNKYEYVPQRVEQDGHIFEFDKDKLEYVYSPQKVESPSSAQIQAQEEIFDTPRALRVGLEKAGTLYTRPFVAGMGGGAGAFVGSLQSGKSFGEAYRSGKEAFSQARDEAILEQAELSNKSPIASFIGELGGNIATAPLMPVKTLAGALKVGATTGAGQAIGEAQTKEEALGMIGGGAALGGGVYGVGKGVAKVFDKTKDYIKAVIPEKILAKVASTTTGIPEQDIITYSKNVDEVNKLAKRFEGNIDLATDEAKERLNSAISSTRASINDSIDNILEKAPKDKFIPLDPILQKVQKVRGQIDADLYPELVDEIDEIIGKVSKKGKPGIVEGQANAISIQELNSIKGLLQSRSKDAFVKNGAIYPRDPQVARAAREGYFEAKKIIDAIVPSIKEANQKHHQLHMIENRINKNILAEGKSSAAFLTAGSKENLRGRNQLKQLGQLTGTNVLDEAEKLSAMRSFADTKLLPQGAITGYAGIRLATGAGLGAAVAEASGGDYKTGAVIGAAATGPTALKALINTGNISSKIIDKSVRKLNDPKVQSVIQKQLGTQDRDDKEIESIKRRLQFYK